MEARIVCARDVTTSDEVVWRALAARAIEPNPLFEPDCVIPAAQYQGFGDEIQVVFAEEGGRLFASFPIRSVRQWQKFPYPFVISKVRRMTLCGTPLVDPDRGEEAMAAIFELLARRRGLKHGRILVLQEVAESGPVDKAIEQAAGALGLPFCRYESWELPFMHRREDGLYKSFNSKKHLSHLGRLRRRLNAALGAEVELVDRSDDPAAIEELIRLEGLGYKGRNGIAMTTVPGEPDYFRSMCDRFRDEGRLYMYTLEGNDTVCAVLLFVRAGDGLFLLKVGYDPQFAASSPGILLHLDFIALFHDKLDAKWVDACTYEGNETLLRMYPDRHRKTSFFVPLSNNPVDRLAVKLFVLVRPLHRNIVDWVRARRATPSSNSKGSPSPSSAPGGAPAVAEDISL